MHKLYVVSTPIGNLGDITIRGKETLEQVGIVLAEDSRVTEKLFSLIGIKNKILSLHKWNEKERVETVLKLLKEHDVALVSDAGTPTISDPGQFLIEELINHDVEIVSVPGPSAIISAMSISGLKYKSFEFIQFIPKKEKQLIEKIEKTNADILVGYESPNRIYKTLEIIKEYNNELNLVIAREITKKFETVLRGKPSELLEENIKGEIVLMIEISKETNIDDLKERVNSLLEDGKTSKEIIEELKNEGFKKNEIYKEIKDV